MKHNFRTILFTGILSLAAVFSTINVQAQTNPIPFQLSNGTFSFTGFTNDQSTVYPYYMQGWAAPHLADTGATVSYQATGDYALLPKSSSATLAQIRNEGATGISIKAGCTTAPSPMAIAMAMDTRGVKNITVSWSASLVSDAPNVDSRVQLQYRIGVDGNWTSVPGGNYVATSGAGGGATEFGPTALPVAIEGQPEVQFRWFIYQTGSFVVSFCNGDHVKIESVEIKPGLIVTPAPGANYTFTATDLNVSFTDASIKAPTSWLWTFDDGSTSTLQNPSHTYTAAGTYNVKLKVSNAGGSDSITKEVIVTEPVVDAPEAGYTYSANLLAVTFTDTSTNFPTSWVWDFGDGSTSVEQNPVHTFAAAGTYQVELKSTNAGGADSITKEIVVTNQTQNAPKAKYGFAANKLVITFSDSSTNNPTSWTWSFDDGESSIEKNPVHTYTAAGTYSVKLVVSNLAGKDSITKEIVVSNTTVLAPIAQFEFVATNLSVAFGDSSINAPTSWTWNFGDGAASTEQHPTHAYTTSGTYTVKLLVSNSAGKDSITKDVTVTNVGLASELESAKTVQIYPNPASSNFTIAYNQFNKESEAVVSIMDITGKVISQVQMNATIQTIDVSTLEQGVYLIRIADNNNTFIRRVEVIR